MQTLHVYVAFDCKNANFSLHFFYSLQNNYIKCYGFFQCIIQEIFSEMEKVHVVYYKLWSKQLHIIYCKTQYLLFDKSSTTVIVGLCYCPAVTNFWERYVIKENRFF